MEGGPPRFRPGFTCQAVLGIPLGHLLISRTRLSRSMVDLSRPFHYLQMIPCCGPATPPTPKPRRFRLFPFRSPLLGESRLISFPLDTEMFHFSRCSSVYLCIQYTVARHYPDRVSPFGNPRIYACSAATRGLSQPSTSFIACECQGIHRAPLIT